VLRLDEAERNGESFFDRTSHAGKQLSADRAVRTFGRILQSLDEGREASRSKFDLDKLSVCTSRGNAK